MEEMNLKKGNLKINRNLLIATSGAFALFSLGFVSGNLTDKGQVISNACAGLMCFNAGITSKMAYDVNKTLKKCK